MKDFLNTSGALAATVTLVAMASPAIAQGVTQVTGVRVNPAAQGMDIVLQTQAGSKAPQVFNTNRGNTWTALIFNAKLSNNQPFQQVNPAPGIASISVTPSGKDGVQVTVVGDGSAPKGQLVRKDGQGLVMNVVGQVTPGRLAQATALPPTQPAAPTQPVVPTSLTFSAPKSTIAQAPAPANNGAPIAPFFPAPTVPRTAPQPPTSIAPPLQPRAVAPPVGDMAISQLDVTPSSIDLGTNERIPRLVLRDAPVREVLSLLARAAGMNLAYSEPPNSGPAGIPGGPGGSSSSGPTISLDIENESVQDVFNYVLRIACVPPGGAGGAPGGGGSTSCASLEANRNGRTIFVGARLPDDARNVVSRTIRLNQVSTEAASNFLTTQGAETQLPFTQVQIQTVGEGAAARTVETRTPTILALRASEGVGPLLLRGLSVSGDNRTSTVTLTGTPKKVEIATSLLTQLDVRKRQAAVTVKVVDIDLNAIDKAGTSLGFATDNVVVQANQGAASVQTGNSSLIPSSSRLFGAGLAGFNWGALLQASLENQNAKILTDPTLIIQEGQSSGVKVVEEVITNYKFTQTASNGLLTTNVEVEKQDAGLNLNIDLRRIDDNGFVSMEIASKISAPKNQTQVTITGIANNSFITLLQKRDVSTGLVRVRDGQTLVITGVIQETDRSTVIKTPILGDLPIIGALFRNTRRDNQRREVVILVTPKILDDTDRSMFGYGYNPGKEAQQFISK